MRFLVLALLAGCTVMTTAPAAEWPKLKVTEHYVPNAEMRDRCGPLLPFWMTPEACAYWNLKALTCDIYYSADFKPAAYVIEHERKHCEGWMH